ncbi:hypothetical protein [uncultured Desulfosarcina sp.]|uniref:hypothetical protein n=1 Tax=uncultured Desulfosarcina sp. TaxID=218289 RepID=UPI0029C66156|nr:hypothetical protein [uncultured Desulfosarcina sp.]
MNGKTKDPSSQTDESTPLGKGAAEIDNPGKASRGGSEDLNADELAAFKKIMGEIDGQEEEKLNDANKGSGFEEKDDPELTKDELAQLNGVIETINSENQTDKDIPDSTIKEDTPSDEGGDESLDEDQQRAFESIMAQIESGGAGNRDPEKKASDASESEITDDFTAELEKVVKEAAVDDKPAVAEAKSDASDDDGLDPEQQQALESIMAQINGDGAADEDTDSKNESGIEPESETADDFTVGSEKVDQDADTAKNDDIQDADSAESDDALNKDQQQAFESIMAQIEGGNTEPSTPEPAGSELKDSQAEETSEDQEKHPGWPTNDDADEDSHDISHDIEDILTEISSTEEASHLPEAGSGDPVSESAPVGSSEKSIVKDGDAVHKKEDSGLEHTDHPQPSTLEIKPSAKGPSTDQLTAKSAIPGSLKTFKKAQPLREATKSTGGRQKKTILAAVIAILFLALTGYFYGISPRIVDSARTFPDPDSSRQDAVVETHPAKLDQESVVVVQSPSDQSRLKTAAENLDRLRNELIEKRSEIEELRTYYQAGIDAEIQEIVERVRQTGKGPVPFNSVLADARISLGLSAIQRRDTYIKKLETPTNALFWDSEELLFFSRKAGILALMVDKTSDIDVEGFIKQADEIRQVHGNALARLNIDTVPATPLALESIWQDIEKRLPTTTIKLERDNLITDTDNAAIWKNICDGDFTQKNKLTELSPEAARCLATWKGKDLFLNALTELSPEAARHLAAWDGDWLGLNGLKELSPEAAVHLSRWKGKGLSLNGLSRLSPRLVAILSEWQGEQIELVNVKHMAYWENPKTRLFLSEDLKRKQSALRK